MTVRPRTTCRVIVPTINKPKERTWQPPKEIQDKQQSVRRWLDSTRTSQLSGELQQLPEQATHDEANPTDPGGTHEPAQTIHSESTLEYLDKPLSENDDPFTPTQQHAPPPCRKSPQSDQDASSHHTPTNKPSHGVQPRLSSQKLANAPGVPPATRTAPVEQHGEEALGMMMEERAGPWERTTESGTTAETPTPEIQQQVPQGRKEHHSSDLSLADLLNLRKKPAKQARKKTAATKSLSTATTRNPARPPASHPTRRLRRNNSSCRPPPAKPPLKKDVENPRVEEDDSSGTSSSGDQGTVRRGAGAANKPVAARKPRRAKELPGRRRSASGGAVLKPKDNVPRRPSNKPRVRTTSASHKAASPDQLPPSIPHTPPDRRARLSYYRAVDAFQFEEEVVLDL